MLLNRQDIIQYLPHRDPFLFLDSVETIDLRGKIPAESLAQAKWKNLIGVCTTANFYVRENLNFFEGHFPGHPILPGVIQVEMMAQASCLGSAYGLIKDLSGIKPQIFLCSVSNARFRQPIIPGMHLRIESKCVRAREMTIDNECSITSEGKVMSECRLLSAIKLGPSVKGEDNGS